MAGDWIKITHGLHSKPEVFGISRELGMSVDEVVGYLCRFWVWADCNTVDGHVDHMRSTDVDHVVDRVGFSSALISVGWLVEDGGGVGFSIPNFEDHNGDSAKKRAMKTKAQRKWREKSVDADVDNNVDIPRSTGASTREEKRREEKVNAATQLKEDSQQSSSFSKDKTPTSTTESTREVSEKKRKVPFPDNFVLTPSMRQYAQEKLGERVDADRMFEHFEAHHRKKGDTFIDWNRAWVTWVLGATTMGKVPLLSGMDGHRATVLESKRQFLAAAPKLIEQLSSQSLGGAADEFVSGEGEVATDMFLPAVEAKNGQENDSLITMRPDEVF